MTPYYYHPIFVSLTPNELKEYSELSVKIARCKPDDSELNPHQLEIYQSLLLKRARILKNASNKLQKLIELIPSFKEQGIFDRCLVYCSDGRDAADSSQKTIQRVVSELNSNLVTNCRFTSLESMAEREVILRDFSSGAVSTIVAIKCLDEGVDVPATRYAIIMASTSNPREYIQRRGRILRRAPGKDFSVLYDFIVVPSGDSADSDERQILLSEYRRFREFSDLSLNKSENKEKMFMLLNKYNINPDVD